MPFSSFTAFLEHHTYLAYPLLFFGSFIEILIPFSFFIPGEIFFYSGGLLAAIGYLNFWLVAAACIAGGILGDLGSFYLGAHYAPRVERHIGTGFAERIYRRGKDFVAHHKDRSVLFARFLGPASWVAPFLAGAARMRLKRFLMLDPAAAVVSIGFQVAIGYGVGVGYEFARKFVHNAAFFFALPFVIALALPFIVEHRRARKERTAKAEALGERSNG